MTGRTNPVRILLALICCLFASDALRAGGPGRAWDPFLDTLQARTLNWFLKVMPENTGLTPDRWPDPSPSSIAAVGFALTSYPVAAERGLITRKESVRRVLMTLRFLWRAPQNQQPAGAIGYRGFFYHFVATADGTRVWNCELSTIDTALLMAGVLFCQAYYHRPTRQEREIRRLADSLYRRVDWTWAAQGRPGIALAWTPETGMEKHNWHGYNEAMILYILALGSPTHPVPPEGWTYWTSTYVWASYFGSEFVSFGPLFGHQFSHCWIDFRGIRDPYMSGKGIDYFENSRRATYAQQTYAAHNPLQFRGYSTAIWGITASDGPGDTAFVVDGVSRKFHGYAARGVSVDWSLDDGTIAPTGAGGSVAFAPEICIPALKAMRAKLDSRLWTTYGFRDAFNLTFVSQTTGPSGWVDRDYLGIDQGPIAIMVENLRDGLVWNAMKKSAYIVRGLRRAGFTGGWLGTQ